MTSKSHTVCAMPFNSKLCDTSVTHGFLFVFVVKILICVLFVYKITASLEFHHSRRSLQRGEEIILFAFKILHEIVGLDSLEMLPVGVQYFSMFPALLIVTLNTEFAL